ncbi:MAG: hypothetical protein Q7R88_00540 [bacterium]|nr:hypothetical protein [bacterium]
MPRKHTKQRVEWWSEEFKRLLATPLIPEGVPKDIDGCKVLVWWECTWRREPCRKELCRFSGRFEKVKRLLGLPDEPGEKAPKEKSVGKTMEEALATPENDLADLREVTAFQAKDLGLRENEVLGEEITEEDFDENGEYMGEEEPARLIPEPETFLLYRRVKRWSAPLVRYVAEAGDERKQKWAESEAAHDVLWYSSLLVGKIYRQLSTKWEISHDIESMEDMKVEFIYTGYVLREISRIIEHSLTELVQSESDLLVSLRQFRRLKGSILDLTRP